MLTHLLQKSLWAPVANRSLPAPHFAYSPVVRADSFLFVSGLVGLDPSTGQLIEGGMGAQAWQILTNLTNLCHELNVEMDQLMLVRVYCADFSQFGELNHVWESFFREKTPPARTSVGVSALPLGARIEMEFQFVIDPSML